MSDPYNTAAPIDTTRDSRSEFTANRALVDAYNASSATPHRKVLAAQAAEAKLLPATGRVPSNEFAHLKNLNRGATAEQILENAMLHGEDS